MGTIVSRKRKDGTIAYMAKIRIKRDGVIYKESKTFNRKAAANGWIIKREDELSQPGAIELANAPVVTLAHAIDKYVSASLKKIGRTKAQVLAAIKTYDIAAKSCRDIISADIVQFATELGRTRKPQTVNNYISHLAAVFHVARPAWAIELNYQAMRDAQIAMKRLGIIKNSDKKERRPTLDEMNRIMALYAEREERWPSMAPMTHIVAFALFSTRRQDEITRIRWEDFDEEGKRVLVRDMKSPAGKVGNHVWCNLPQQAVDIINAMPRVRDEIFPYNGESISASFTRICALLEIVDMDFHRLRHEGISRLFEMGWGIAQVSTVSGHRSWSSLQRYAHIRQLGDKYADWPWLSKATEPARAGSRPMSSRVREARGLPLEGNARVRKRRLSWK